jgi:hypothetical protein
VINCRFFIQIFLNDHVCRTIRLWESQAWADFFVRLDMQMTNCGVAKTSNRYVNFEMIMTDIYLLSLKFAKIRSLKILNCVKSKGFNLKKKHFFWRSRKTWKLFFATKPRILLHTKMCLCLFVIYDNCAARNLFILALFFSTKTRFTHHQLTQQTRVRLKISICL